MEEYFCGKPGMKRLIPVVGKLEGLSNGSRNTVIESKVSNEILEIISKLFLSFQMIIVFDNVLRHCILHLT